MSPERPFTPVVDTRPARDLVLAGVGGQGTILASRILARAALVGGLPVRTAETIGTAQRGGSVVSHIRIGGLAHSPLVPKASADALIGFEPAEAVRALPYLRSGGIVIVSSRTIAPVGAARHEPIAGASTLIEHLRASSGATTVVDTDAVCAECGSPKVLNTTLLGAAAAAGALGLSFDEIEVVLREVVPARFLEMNLCALRAGVRCGEGTVP